MATKRRAAVPIPFAVVAIALSGCIGTIDRDEFEAEVRSRGGGFDESLVIDAAGAVGDRVGTIDFEITALTASPLSGIVTMRVLDPRNPNNIDNYTIRDGTIHLVNPVQMSARDDVESKAFSLQSLALDELNEMADEALAEYETNGGYVDSVSISKNPATGSPEGAEARISFSIESARSRAIAYFRADGTLISVDML